MAIGANAVVNKSFTEPNISIEGVPAAKISKKGSEGLLVRATGKKGEGEFLSLKKKSNSMTIPRFYKKRLILALLALITLLIFTHIPQKNMPYQFGRLNRDKVVHVIAYGILTTLFILAIRPPRRWVSYACLLAVFIVIAALDERTQAYVGRTVSSMDWAANIVGVLTTMIISLLLKRKKLIKKPQPDKRVLSQSVADSREATFLDAT